MEAVLRAKTQSPTQHIKAERNYGIDLLRILSMLYVLVLHVLGNGGVLGAATEGTAQYMASWFLEIWTYGAVDIFALISGYVSYTEYEKKTDFSNYIVLWLQAVLYGVAATLVFNCIHPEWVTKNDLFQMFFPISNGLYWYLSAYTGLFFMMPILNAGLRKCSKRTMKRMVFVIFAAFSVWASLIDRFELKGGYSFAWIVLLYILGAAIKKCNIGANIKAWQAFLGIVLCCLIGWGWKIYGVEAEWKIWSIHITKNLFVSYISPTTLLASVFYVIGFSKLKIPPKAQKGVSFCAAGAFAAYLLNCQRCIWEHELPHKFAYLADKNVGVLLLCVIAVSLAFLIGSILIDQIRIWGFKLLRVKQLVRRFVTFAENLLFGADDQSYGDENDN